MREQEIWQEILEEGLDDWVPVDRLVGLAKEYSEDHGGSYKDLVSRVLSSLLTKELIRVGEIGEDGFEAWPGDQKEVERRVVMALGESGWVPAGDVCWLANTAAGDCAARELRVTLESDSDIN
ncbi:hypothetical protein ACFYVL_31590 [Streptomyces sp. NPDC004111]|uniref:hypothetical protein n=1 Tax=Streptomyces sp. NPDC004111 TaxID=3364690 RepID=UPI0036CEBA93